MDLAKRDVRLAASRVPHGHPFLPSVARDAIAVAVAASFGSAILLSKSAAGIA